tara:strand:- start:1255 stop:1470 length:216 start_codon:yes stop_codon:yes gene_type:complete
MTASDGKSVAATGPASGESNDHVLSLSAAQVEEAIEAANAAMPVWRAKKAAENSQLLKRMLTTPLLHSRTY